jgi:prepilin-type N-terminal cleavage/methylation domain-containing protein
MKDQEFISIRHHADNIGARANANTSRAFTLIELLIVVLIIAILAAIAIPNFLEFQTRAKTSRVKADMRTIVTALEAYAVDHGEYPPHLTHDYLEIGYPDRYRPLTTPIAFLTGMPALDQFYIQDITGQGGSGKWFSWTNFASYPETHTLYASKDSHRWMLRSRGPDGVNEPNDVRNAFFSGGLLLAPSMLYDPSNGTVSQGDLLRTAMINN